MSKRMFSTDIVESDAFLDMPLTAQALYMHLNMNADNDGFVNPKRILRMVGGNDDDLRILIAKRFILVFQSGVIVIKHWWINNTKRADRYTSTTYQHELSQLQQKDNKSYTELVAQLPLETEVEKPSATTRQPSGNQRLPQFNAVHVQFNSNHVQGNGNQPQTTKQQGFNKSIQTPEQKRAYAKAAQADREQVARAQAAQSRKGSFVSLEEAFGDGPRGIS